MIGGREPAARRSSAPDPENQELARARVVVTGLVQGVCFRAETQRQASRLGIRGWVRNRSDGAVEGIFEGCRAAVEDLVAWCGRGPPHARVANVDVQWEPSTGEFDRFGVRS